MVVNGKFFGLDVFGNVSAEQIRRGTEIMETVATLKRHLAELFDENVAEAIVSRLGISQAELNEGNISDEEERFCKTLAALGIIGKANYA